MFAFYKYSLPRGIENTDELQVLSSLQQQQSIFPSVDSLNARKQCSVAEVVALHILKHKAKGVARTKEGLK